MTVLAPRKTAAIMPGAEKAGGVEDRATLIGLQSLLQAKEAHIQTLEVWPCDLTVRTCETLGCRQVQQ